MIPRLTERSLLKLCALSLGLLAAPAYSSCPTGAYRAPNGEFVVIAPLPDPAPPGQRYLFGDGRRGNTLDPNSPVDCAQGLPSVARVQWARIPMTETLTSFESGGTKLAGKLIEPQSAGLHPLVVMVHGSEHTSAVKFNSSAYVLAAQGIAVFVYDKRGTGASEGEYTQNFELLADDAGSAFVHARRMAAGRYDRAGFFGGSQGGWVAPLAASRSDADFVAVGFGLIASPIDEDRDQMLQEARAMGLDSAAMADIRQLSAATAKLVSSHFVTGYAEMAAARKRLAGKPWAAKIEGEYSGEMLRTSDADLHRVGQPRFDNLELIWNYDSVAVLKKLKTPLLWVLAGEDREAPIDLTKGALLGLMKEGKPIQAYLFPNTDHGIYEFVTLPDGSRRMTRVANGYFRLLADFMHGSLGGSYGNAVRLR